jgi:hypothetical protein
MGAKYGKQTVFFEHLLPQAEAEHKKYSLFALGAGILVALTIVLSKS